MFLEFADIRTKQRISRAKTNILVLPHYTDQDFTEIFLRQDDCDTQSHLILFTDPVNSSGPQLNR